jgi:hypothetical protein
VKKLAEVRKMMEKEVEEQTKTRGKKKTKG